MGLNVAVFLVQLVLQRFNPDAEAALMAWGMLTPTAPVWWTWVTYAFLHGGFLHILGNMLFLWVFGVAVEDKLGRVGFLVLYLVGAVAAGGLHAVFQPNPVIGASGAVAAVSGAFLVFFPRSHIKVLLFFFIIGFYTIPAWFFILFAIAKDFLFTGLGGGGVAYLAHLGGYGLGIGVAIFLLATRLSEREGTDLFTMARQARRRRVFAEAAHEMEARQAREAWAKASAEIDDALAAARAKVAQLAATGQTEQAAQKWVELKRAYATSPAQAITMSRKAQLDIANALAQSGAHAHAADAYERFAESYPTDPESPRVRVMLALIAARYLKQRDRAKAALAGIRDKLTDPDQHALAMELREELNA